MIRQRLNKFIANYGFCSRRKVDLIIKNGEVLVNLSLVQIGIKVNTNLKNIYLNCKELKNSNYKSNTILLNIPKNVINSCSDKRKRKPSIDFQRVNFSNISLGNLKDGECKLINNDEFRNIK